MAHHEAGKIDAGCYLAAGLVAAGPDRGIHARSQAVAYQRLSAVSEIRTLNGYSLSCASGAALSPKEAFVRSGENRRHESVLRHRAQ